MSRSNIKDKGIFLFLIALIFYCIYFIYIGIWRYDNFYFTNSSDTLDFEQIIYNTLHGKPFYITWLGINEFEVHNSPFLALLVPFALIIPVHYLLIAVTVLSIAISAIPIYLIAKDNFKNEFLGFLFGISYIMLPALVGQVYQCFHEIIMVLPFLTFAFYYFTKEQFYPFIIMFAIALTVKEDVSLTLFMFAIYALFKKRSLKWYIIPAVVSISWLVLSIKVIIPFFNKSHTYTPISYLSNVGGSLGGVISNILFNPLNILQELTQPHKLYYLFLLLLPVGLILPFFSPVIIFAIPSILLNLLGGSQRLRLDVLEDIPMIRHMSLMATVFLFISAIYAVQNIRGLLGKYSTQATAFFLILLLSLIAYNDRFILHSDLSYSYFHKMFRPSKDSINKAISLIPREATVQADIGIANHLYDRRQIYLIQSPSFNRTVESDYVVFIGDYDATITEKYNLLMIGKNICVFKRKLKLVYQ